MSSVEALLRRHENFEKSCITYLEKLPELEELIEAIRQHDNCDDIENWYAELCNRKERLLETSGRRKRILNESKALQQMLLHLYEVSISFKYFKTYL